MIFAASLISLRLGISVAIIEIILGVAAGNLGLEPREWMLYLAGFGGIILTYLAGTEVDIKIMRERFPEAIAVGAASFLAPFTATFLFTYYVTGWDIQASLLAGTAMSSTSLAVVYSALVEFGLAKSRIGNMLMAYTFVTNMGTVVALTVLFIKPDLYTALFLGVSTLLILAAAKFSPALFGHPAIKDKVIEPEIKYLFLLLLAFVFFAQLGKGQAVLPAFLLGLVMSGHIAKSPTDLLVRNRLRTVAYAIITPVFFIVGGMNLSVSLLAAGAALFAVLLALKIGSKFLGIYLLVRRYLPENKTYASLLMSTGLTFGLIACVFGESAGIIDDYQYSVLVGVVILSGILPTIAAQKWFMPLHSEDVSAEAGEQHSGLSTKT